VAQAEDVIFLPRKMVQCCGLAFRWEQQTAKTFGAEALFEFSRRNLRMKLKLFQIISHFAGSLACPSPISAILRVLGEFVRL
jgi:hypothetical protein